MMGPSVRRIGWLIVAAALPAAPAPAQMQLGSQAQQILSINLRTSQFDKARRFYLEAVGLKEMPGSSPAGKPHQSSSLSFSGTYADSFITLSHDDADGTTPLKPGALQRLVFRVTDAKATFARARATGAPVVSEPRSAHGIADLIVAIVRDPDGNEVEFVQPPAQPARR